MNKTHKFLASCFSLLVVACGSEDSVSQEPQASVSASSKESKKSQEDSKANSKDGVKTSISDESDNFEPKDIENLSNEPVKEITEEDNKMEQEEVEPKEDSDGEVKKSKCFGYMGFLNNKRWEHVYGSLSTELKNDIDSVFDLSQIVNSDEIMTRPESNQPSYDQEQCEASATLLAPMTAEKSERLYSTKCIGFLQNPNPEKWHCEQLSIQGKEFNQENCHIADEYEQALACAPKDTSEIDYSVDDATCKGVEVNGRNDLATTLNYQNSRFMNNPGFGNAMCRVNLRSKCNDLSKTKEEAKKYVVCEEVKEQNSGSLCHGFDTDQVPGFECYENFHSHNEKRSEGCDSNHFCIAKK